MEFLDNILESAQPKNNPFQQQLSTKEYNLSDIHLNLVSMQKDIVKGKRKSEQRGLRHAKSFDKMKLKHKAGNFQRLKEKQASAAEDRDYFAYGNGPAVKERMSINGPINSNYIADSVSEGNEGSEEMSSILTESELGEERDPVEVQ